VLQGNLRVGELKLDKFKASNLAADIKIDKSLITIAPLTARLYGGALAGNITVTAHESPTISVRQNLKGLQMGALLTKTDGAGRLGGKASVELDIGAQGNTVGELRKALTGSVSLALAHGYLAGINLRSVLIEGKKDLGTKSPERIFPANFSDLTDFSELTSLFNLKDGKVGGTSFKMKSPLMRTTGEGEFDLVSGEMNYRLGTTVSNSINRRTGAELFDLKGVAVPIRVYGPYATPNIAFDFAAASGGNVAKLAAAYAAKAGAEAAAAAAASTPVPAHKPTARQSVPAKSKAPAKKPVKKPQN
jgi:AsmA protein